VTWDAVTGRTLIFGGNGPGGALNDLWGWDGVAWTLLDDGSGEAPSKRDDAQLVADPDRGVVVMHGGRSSTGADVEALSDTWEWAGSRWHRFAESGAAGQPPGRIHPASGWDPGSGHVFLAGGLTGDESILSDTWAFDGQAWERIDEVGFGGQIPLDLPWDPNSESLLAVVFDPAGIEADLVSAALWQWTGSRWQASVDGGRSFSPIQPTVGTATGLLLTDGGGALGEFVTWAWDGSSWTQMPGVNPPARNGQALAYDAARDRVVLFGGFTSAGDLADLWEWDGATWEERSAP
jgi:hypothetical protein